MGFDKGQILPKQFGYLTLLVIAWLFVVVFIDFEGNRNVKKHGNEAHYLRLLHPKILEAVTNSLRTNQASTNSTSSLGSNTTSIQSYQNHTFNANPRTDAANCSCEKDLNSMYCCQRSFILVHKMGVTAAEEIKETYFSDNIGTPQIMNDHRYGQLFDAAFDLPLMDYRHAVITRDWYQAIISGYLYHKSGRECWLDWFGNPGHDGWLLNNRLEHWENRLRHNPTTTARNLQWNPGNDRDLCKYLAEEPEEMGLRVYSAWAMASFMDPLLQFRQRRLEMEAKSGLNRTIFLCFEQLTSPSSHSDAVNVLAQWFYPRNQRKLRAVQQEKYNGGHATEQDPHFRSRLNGMVADIDAKYFGGSIAQGSAVFACQ